MAEIGDDVSVFPSAGHLLACAGLCPRVDEGAVTRRSRRNFQAQFLRLELERLRDRGVDVESTRPEDGDDSGSFS